MGIAKSQVLVAKEAEAVQLGACEREALFEPFITKPVVVARMEVQPRTVTRLMKRGVLRLLQGGAAGADQMERGRSRSARAFPYR